MMYKKLICVVLIMTLISSISIIQVFGKGSLIVNESFNNYPTNSQPDAVSVSGSISYYVDEYMAGDKGLAMPLLIKQTRVGFDGECEGDFSLSFDFSSKGAPFSGEIRLTDEAGSSFIPLSFSENNSIFASRNRKIGGYNVSSSNVCMANVLIAVHTDRSLYDIYLNGKCVLSEWPIEQNLAGFATAEFVFSSSYEDSELIIDNVNVYSGAKRVCCFPAAKYNSEVLPPVEKEVFEPGDKILFYQNFNEKSTTGMNVYNIGESGGWIKEKTYEDYYLSFKSNGEAGNYYSTINYNENGILYPNIVQVMDVIVNDVSIADLFFMRDDGFVTTVRLSNSSLICSGKTVYTMEYGKWYRVACAYNFVKKTYDVSVYDNTGKELCNEKDLDMSNQSGIPIHMRISMHGTSAANFGVDNILIYEGKEYREMTEEEIKENYIVPSNVLPTDMNERAALGGYNALHTTSGVLYMEGEKILLPKPYTEDGITMIPVRAICEALGHIVTYDAENQTIRIDDMITYKVGKNIMSVYGTEIPLEMAPFLRNGLAYVPLQSLLEDGFKNIVTYDTTCQNPGLVVFGDKAYTMPAKCQAVNNFMLYYRPRANEILDAFKKTNPNNEHPRLIGRREDFEKIIEDAKTDPVLQEYINISISKADQSDNSLALGLAYQLTGKSSYAERAYESMKKTIDSFVWATDQYLTVASYACDVAVLYDMTYDGLTNEQRQYIEEGLKWQALDDVMEIFKGKRGTLHETTVLRVNNWSEVCNGGIAMAAIALMDVYPELCSELMEYFIQAIEVMLNLAFTPDGASEEGPAYSEYGKAYLFRMLQAMDKGLGTEFNITTLQGFERCLKYMLFMGNRLTETSGINFNYGDSKEDRLSIPANALWLANKIGQKDVAAAIYHQIQNSSDIVDVLNDPSWIVGYQSWMKDYKFTLPLDDHFKKVEVGVMRESWTQSGKTYAAFKGGEYVGGVSHKQMDNGTFVFDSMGERWAIDLGSEDYAALNGYANIWDMKEGRWYAFRNRASGHNTVVINPKTNYPADHAYDASTYITKFESKENGAIGILDMLPALKRDVSAARRGYFLVDNRQSLVIRDEITLNKKTEFWWLMYTRANEIDIDPNNSNIVYLRQNGKTLKVEYVTSVPMELRWEDAVPLEGTPALVPTENKNIGIKRLALKGDAAGAVRITVKLSPYYINGTDVEDYNKPIDTWKIPDIAQVENFVQPKKLSVDGIYIDGELLEGFDKDIYIYNNAVQVVDDEKVKLPEVTAKSPDCKVSVEQGETARDGVKIRVEDNTYPNNVAVYSIGYELIPKVQESKYLNAYQVKGIFASSIQQSNNPPINMLDGNLDTRFAAQGDGEWAIFDFGEPVLLNAMEMAVYDGSNRQQYFSIEISQDGKEFTEVYDNGITSGKTTETELFTFDDVTARYVKITFHMTSVGDWNSPTEVIFGTKK